MAHDAEPHMKYTLHDLGSNLIIRYAAFTQEPVEHVTIYGHYAYTHTKERGPEFIPYKGEARA